MNRIGPPKFKAFAAGSMPKGAVHPQTLELLKRNNFQITDFRSKGWEEFSGPDAPALDFVFPVCDNAASEVCPVWPGQPISAHWGVLDPVAAAGNLAQVGLAFAETFRMLHNRIHLFVNLPLATIDRLSLQRRLDAIGKLDDTQAAPR